MKQIDMTRWQYQKEADVYWQTGIAYCQSPAAPSLETLGIYVPGAYMKARENGDGTFTCEADACGAAGGYTAGTAPIVLPVDTPGYKAMSAPDGYLSAAEAYTSAGFVYVRAGCRGRDEGAPGGVTDLKAAIRFIRCNQELLPGSAERIFTFGMSGGGAQSALLGASGDSSLYEPYLKAIGAAEGVSDAVAGSMCWCPITNLDYASEAYEWNLGVTRTDLPEELRRLSDEMAGEFALHVNALELKDENGCALTLEPSQRGVYQAGSYYEYLKAVIEASLNHFLSDTEFPYTAEEEPKGFPGGMPGAGAHYYTRDGIDRSEAKEGLKLAGAYETAGDYIRALNQNTEWVSYDGETNTASITSIEDFVCALKRASKGLGAFDALDASQGENTLFGYGDGAGAHFDRSMAALLAGTEYEKAFETDLRRADALGNPVDVRVNMYTPLYYLCAYYGGFQTSRVAPLWRIRTGISQSDTALSTEVNLALALKNYGAQVDFETVWGRAHVRAERKGGSAERFIEWVQENTLKKM